MKNKETKPLQRVINFSGGRSSALMTILNYQPGDLVIFCDTGREHEKTYKFINDFEAHEGIPLIRLRYMDSDKPFDALLARKKYKVIPNRMKRICTSELKIRLAKRYLREHGIQKFENFIGFRSDEPQRVIDRKQQFKKVVDRFPLYDSGIDKPMVLDYWKRKPYDLEIPSILGNCTLCFMKGTNAIMAILTVYPELADPWIRDEELASVGRTGTGRKYFPDVTMQQLKNMAGNNLFKDQVYDLNEVSAAFNCACTSF